MESNIESVLDQILTEFLDSKPLLLTEESEEFPLIWLPIKLEL